MLILTVDDLSLNSCPNAENPELMSNFKDYRMFAQANLIIYRSPQGKFKLVKNRNGRNNVFISKEQFESLKKKYGL